DGERIGTAAVHHRDPEKLPLVEGLWVDQSLDLDAPALATLRTARPALRDATPEQDGGLTARAVLLVPLQAHRTVLGALTPVAEEGDFDAYDQACAEEFGWHAAMAINNARLLEEHQRALAEAEDARARTMRLQAVADALSETMTSAEVADVLMREGLVALRAQ